MTYPQHLRPIPIAMTIMGTFMGLISGLPEVRAESLPSTAMDGVTLNSASIMPSGKTDDPADGFTGRGSPSRRSSGGSRGDCGDLLVALVPGDDVLAVSEAGCNLPSSSEPALTTAAMPVLWFHIPTQTAPIEGEFALLDETQLALSVQTITLPQTGGIVGIQVDDELEVGSTYNWVFSLLANPRKPSDNPRVAGTLQRIDPSPEVLTEINAADSLQKQADIWMNQGVWHNALTTVATLRQSGVEQTVIEQQWQDFLEAAGLAAIADAPIHDCCRSDSL